MQQEKLPAEIQSAEISDSEKLLCAWMKMSLEIRSNRILSHLSFNEITVCNLLLHSDRPLTASMLCRRMRLLKSQMNHLLTAMEQKGLIERSRSSTDRRNITVTLRQEALADYYADHERILAIAQAVAIRLGAEKTRALTDLLQEATTTVDKLTREES
jgi:DNA-binding MarR family transcriptional regulator